METLLIVGFGHLGSAVLDILARQLPQWRFVLVSRNAEIAMQRLNLSRYVLSQWDMYPTIEHISGDVLDTEEFAQIVESKQPSIIFNATTPFPWWQIDQLPNQYGKLAHAAGPGMWAAFDLVLPLGLSNALERTTFDGIIVNGCYPDMTNAFLSELKHSPVIGIGNVSNLIPGLRLAYSSEWSVDPRDVSVRMVGHHFTSLNGPSLSGGELAPYFLELQCPTRRHVITGPSSEPFEVMRRQAKRTRGMEGQAVTANSAATVLAALMSRSDFHAHCPGALGLPGGYPVVLSNRKVNLDLPGELDLQTAIQINEMAQKFDGVEWVGPGEVHLTEAAIAAQEAIFGEAYGTLHLAEVMDVGLEMLAKLRSRYGVGYEVGSGDKRTTL